MPKVGKDGKVGIYMRIDKKSNDLWVSKARKAEKFKTDLFLEWLEKDPI